MIKNAVIIKQNVKMIFRIKFATSYTLSVAGLYAGTRFFHVLHVLPHTTCFPAQLINGLFYRRNFSHFGGRKFYPFEITLFQPSLTSKAEHCGFDSTPSGSYITTFSRTTVAPRPNG